MRRRPGAKNARPPARPKRLTGRRRPAHGRQDRAADLVGLTKAEASEIQRRVQDLDDPTRYLLVSDFGPRLKLYYDIANDAYVMNDPARATLFKRREAALAVGATLGKGIKLLQCKTRIQSGKRVPILTRGLKAQEPSR